MSLIDLLFFALVIVIILAFFGVIWMIGGYYLAHKVDQDYRSCPACKTKGAGTIIDSEVVLLSNSIDRTKLTPYRVKREKVTDQYQCESCQHTWEKTFDREDRSPIEGTPTS